MPTNPLADEKLEEAVRLVQKYVDAGYVLGGIPSAMEAAGAEAVSLGIVRASKTLGTRYRMANNRLGLYAIVPDSKPQTSAKSLDSPEIRRDIRDTDFWRKRAKTLETQLGNIEHIAEQLSGIRHVPIEIPDWLLAKSNDRKRSVVGILLTDIHAGEVIDSDEILGLNAYNPEICRVRLRRLFTAACTIPLRWTVDCKNQGVLLALGGDLISGDIHEELIRTNALTSHEQVRLVVEEVTAGITHLLGVYDRVHVASVPGNHSRQTNRPTAKLYSRLSYDTLAATMIQDRFLDDARVTFQIGTATDAVIPILGYTVMLSHGDKLGSGGGQGFGGAIFPIVRGTKKLEAQQSRVNRRPDLILHGHFHTSANPGNVLSNGSVVGYSEYANGLRASVEPPSQWLFLITERWGLRERIDVKLEDPVIPPLPRVRVPATMARAAK